MNLENFLFFVMNHNTTIIEALIACSLVITVIIAFRGFLAAKEPESTTSIAGLGDLEGTLKKILAQASQVPATGSSETAQKLIDEIEMLKASLQEKHHQIEEMKESVSSMSASVGASASSGMSTPEKEKLESQLKELQAKLSEYEIISEDIADLSLYKEQNVKLQQEVAALKGGGARVSAPAPAQVIAEVKPVKPPPPPQAESSAAAEPPPWVEPPSEEALPAPVEVKEVAPQTPPPAPVEAKPAAISGKGGAAVPEAPAIEHVVDDDLLAEFSAAVEKQQGGRPKDDGSGDFSGVDLGTMDVEKMMEEAVAIDTDVPDVDAAQALGTVIDENKILQEAKALQGVSPEDKKLMGQFENFVKKNE